MADQTLPLHLFALGPPEARLGENLLTFPTRKTLALLIYLGVEAGLQPREHLAALLWPEANPERSYANLRSTLGHLQTALTRQTARLPLHTFPSHINRWVSTQTRISTLTCRQ